MNIRSGFVSIALAVTTLLPLHSRAIAAGDPKTVVAFVDVSTSTGESLTRYREDLQKVVESLGPGDRIVVATINANTLTKFVPSIDRTLPAAPAEAPASWSSYMENELKRKKREKEEKEAAASALEQSKLALDRQLNAFWASATPSPRTAVLDSLIVADKLLSTQKGRRILIFFSDMVESSERFDFEKVALTEQKVSEIVEGDRKAGVLPKLDSVRVYVAGATASSASKEKQIESFWAAYFAACGCDFDRTRYAHALINYAE